MGVYDHMMRPSMGHRMQVELRESMQEYHQNKSLLNNQLSQLCLDNKDLYTSPIPPSPVSSIKSWANKGSKFSSAPEKAAQRARLAKLEHENTILSKAAEEQELRRNSLLPPIDKEDAGNDAGKTGSNPNRTEEQKHEDVEKKNLRFGTNVELKTPLDKKTNSRTSRGKKKVVRPKKSALKEKRTSVITLPTIYSVDPKRPQWDSGYNHIHRKGKSTTLEKSQIEEDCRNFTQRSVAIPQAADPKRMEIRLPTIPKPPLAKVKFTHHQPQKPAPAAAPVPVEVVYTQSTPADNRPPKTKVQDHFPRNHQRLPEFEDSGSEVDSDDEDGGQLNETDQLQLSPLPVVRLSESKLSRHNFSHKTYHVPRLGLDQSASPISAFSMGTGRSGAIGATYMSQETLEWKGEYMTSGNLDRKSRMLAEILHTVRQRMHDNEEELRASGYNPRPSDMSRVSGYSDIMFLQGKVTPSSGTSTDRTTARHERLMKPSRTRQLVAPGLPQKTRKKKAAQLHAKTLPKAQSGGAATARPCAIPAGAYAHKGDH